MLARTNKLPLALLLAAVALPAWAQGDTPALQDVTLEHRRGGDLGLHSVTLEHRRGGDLGLQSITLEHRRGGDLGLHSVTLEYRLSPVSATLGAANPAGRRVDSPSSNDAVMQLRVKRNGGSGDLTLEALRLVNAGTLDTSATPVNVRLVRDDDADGQANAGEPTIASGRFDASGTAVFGAMTLTLAPSQTVHVLAVVDFPQPVPGDATFVPRAESMSFAQASGPAIAAAGLPLSGQVFTLGRADADPPTITIDAPTDGKAFVNAMSVTPVFSADDGAGGSGVASLAGVMDGTIAVRSGVPLDVSGLPLGTHVLTITARDNAGNVAVSGATFYLERFSVLRGPAAPAPARVPARSQGVTLLQFRLDRRGSLAAGSLGAVSLLASGSGDDSRLARVVLVRDLDSDGVAGAADPVLASGRFPSDEGALALLGFSSALPANGAADFVVACDLSGEERYGDTFAVTLTHAVAGIQAQVVEPLGRPLGGRMIIVEDVTAPVVDIQSPPDGSSVPDVGALTLSFTAQDEPRGSGIATLQANLDGASVVNAQAIELGTLSVGEHRLTVVATDGAGNRATEVSVFRTVTPQQALQDAAGGVQGVINDAATPAAARPLLQDALDLLVGSNGGRSGNGAITLMNNGDVVAAMVKIQQAIRKLRQAADRGAATQELQEKLAEFLGQTMSARVAHLEQLVAADPNVDPAGKMPQIRSFISQGDSAFAAGNYESAVLYYRQAEQRVLELDREAPVVTFLEPSGLVTNDTTPRIRVQYIDLLGLIRTAGVLLFLDGVERTGIAQVGPFQVILDVPDSLALSEGAHTIRVVVPDSAGNVAEVTRTLIVDTTPPTVTFDSPTAFALLRSGSFLLQARYADSLTGVDISTADLTVNLLDLTTSARVDPNGVQLDLQGQLSLTDGPATAEVSIRDRAGNLGRARVGFLVDSLRPEVTIAPPDGTTITDFPVTFEVRVADAGSGLSDAPAQISFNGVDVTSKFQVRTPTRFPVLDVPDVAQVVLLTYTPSVDEFVGFVRDSGTGILAMQADTRDRAANSSQALVRYPVNLGSGGGGGGGAGQRIPAVIQLLDVRLSSIPPPPPPSIDRSAPFHQSEITILAIDLARGSVPVPGLCLGFSRDESWGRLLDHPTLSSITNAQGLAGALWIPGSRAGSYSLSVSVLGDSSVPPLEVAQRALEPTLEAPSDLTVISGSGIPSLITFRAWLDRATGYGLPAESIMVGMRDPRGGLAPPDQSKYFFMPGEATTDGGGTAQFLLGTTSAMAPGEYVFRAILTDWPAVGVDFRVTVLDPGTDVLPLAAITGGVVPDRRVGLTVASGNGQLGVRNVQLAGQLVVQLLQDGTPSPPIDESYKRYDQDGNRLLPDTHLVIRKVSFGISLGGGTLDPSADVSMDGQGRAASTLTFGDATEPHIVTAYFHVYWGPLPDNSASATIAAATFVEGAPEVYFVREGASAETFERADVLIPWNPLASPASSALRYRIEALLPLTEPGTTTGGVEIEDASRKTISSIPGRIGTIGVQDVPLTRVSTDARRSVYRTPSEQSIIWCATSLPPGGTAPALPSDAQVVQVGSLGFVRPFVLADDRTTGPDKQVDDPSIKIDIVATHRENLHPGAVFLLNADDDDENTTLDMSDAPTQPIASENDLIPAHLSTRAMMGTLRLDVDEGREHIRIWTTPTKAPNTSLSLPYEWDLTDSPNIPDIWIEGIVGSPDLKDVRLALSIVQNAGTVAIDHARLTVVPLKILTGPRKLNGVGWKPSGEYALAAGSGGLVMSYRYPDANAALLRSEGVTDRLDGVSWNGDGTLALVVGGDWKSAGSLAKLGPAVALTFDGATLSRVFSGTQGDATHPYDKLFGVAWWPRASNPQVWWAVGERGGKLYQFNYTASTQQILFVDRGWPEHASDLFSVAWRPDGSYALLSGDLSTIHKVTFPGVVDSPIEGPALRSYVAVGWKPDGSYALCGSAGGVVDRFTDSTSAIDTVIPEGSIPAPDPAPLHDWFYQGVTWQPDGHYAILTGGDHGGGAHGLIVLCDGQDWFLAQPACRVPLGACAWRPGETFAVTVGPFDFGE